MPGPVSGMFFYLYLIVDIFSRKIVGWEVHECETAERAALLIQKAVSAGPGCHASGPRQRGAATTARTGI
jgi:putative transposase